MGLPETGWSENARANSWIHVSDLCGRSDRPLQEIASPDPDEVLRATLQAVFLYDEVRLIEYQDFVGIGLRVAQAKRAGLLPPSVMLLAYAHGNHLYLDAAGDVIEGHRWLRIDALERLSLELADCAAFPSHYIRRLYVEQGGFRPRAERHLPYPIRIAEHGLDDLSRGPIDNLVFYGRQTRQKGYPDFVEAVLSLFREAAYADAADQIVRLVLMGVTDPDPRLKDLPIEVEHGAWTLAEVNGMLRRFAPNSLLVLPYRGDNQPLSFFEVIDADCQLLAYDAGGIPELVPPQLHSSLLCLPDPGSLTSAMARAIRLPHWERCRLLKETRRFVRSERQTCTIAYKKAMSGLKETAEPAARLAQRGAITVVVTNLNGPRRYLEDVALGLRNSLLQPARVLLVDDGSTAENLQMLNHLAANAFGKIPTEVLSNATNLGLAGARNVGLARVRTPYVCAHDNDNIVLNHFFYVACRVLDENPTVAAVTAYSRYFEDERYWQREDWGPGYRPLGADLGLALRGNVIGDALAVYRADTLRAIGGWDESTKAKWEDWQLFCRLVAEGHDVWVIPQEMSMYRARAGSMARTYADFPGWLRLSTVLPGLPRAQAVSVLRTLWRLSEWKGGELVPAPALGSPPRKDKGSRRRKRKKIKRALGKPFRFVKRRARMVWRQIRPRLRKGY
jgi:glycosyltransferase involved in cell wall biosynthesis